MTLTLLNTCHLSMWTLYIRTLLIHTLTQNLAHISRAYWALCTRCTANKIVIRLNVMTFPWNVWWFVFLYFVLLVLLDIRFWCVCVCVMNDLLMLLYPNVILFKSRLTFTRTTSQSYIHTECLFCFLYTNVLLAEIEFLVHQRGGACSSKSVGSAGFWFETS